MNEETRKQLFEIWENLAREDHKRYKINQSGTEQEYIRNYIFQIIRQYNIFKGRVSEEEMQRKYEANA